MARFFLDPHEWGEHAALVGDESLHCARVLRAKVGDELVVFDGEGCEAPARVEAISKSRVELALGDRRYQPRPPLRVVLAQAVLKGKAMDWLIQKAVELGVAEIRPVMTRNTVVKPADAKVEKWRRAALEACKQCGQNFLPRIEPVTEISSFLAEEKQAGKAVAALVEPRRRLQEVFEQGVENQQFVYLVGPEGDFTREELKQALKAGYIPVTLGSQVLRSETAALFGLVAASYETCEEPKDGA